MNRNANIQFSLTYRCGWYLPGEFGQMTPALMKRRKQAKGVAASVGYDWKPGKATNDNGVWYVRLVASSRS